MFFLLRKVQMYAPPPLPATHRAHARISPWISLRLSDAYAYKGLTHVDHSNYPLATAHYVLP